MPDSTKPQTGRKDDDDQDDDQDDAPPPPDTSDRDKDRESWRGNPNG